MADKVLPQRVSVTAVRGDVGVRRSPWEEDRDLTGPRSACSLLLLSPKLAWKISVSSWGVAGECSRVCTGWTSRTLASKEQKWLRVETPGRS